MDSKCTVGSTTHHWTNSTPAADEARRVRENARQAPIDGRTGRSAEGEAIRALENAPVLPTGHWRCRKCGVVQS